MKVSIIIPVYNVEAYIERCLLSALNQRYPNIEYILVNDCTPDQSMKVASRVINAHPRGQAVIVVDHPHNQGVSAARNTGVRHASGDYLFFLDSDDELPSDCIEKLASVVQDGKPEFVMGNYEIIQGNKRWESSLNIEPGTLIEEKDRIIQFCLSDQWNLAWSKLIKKNIFLEKDCWLPVNIPLGEDDLWNFHLATVLDSMVYIEDIVYIYHIGEQSVTQRKTERSMNSFYTVLEETIRIAKKNELEQQFPKDLTRYLDTKRIYFLKCLLLNPFDKKYIREQKCRIRLLFKSSVRMWGRRSFIHGLKEKILSFLIVLKTL